MPATTTELPTSSLVPVKLFVCVPIPLNVWSKNPAGDELNMARASSASGRKAIGAGHQPLTPDCRLRRRFSAGFRFLWRKSECHKPSTASLRQKLPRSNRGKWRWKRRTDLSQEREVVDRVRDDLVRKRAIRSFPCSAAVQTTWAANVLIAGKAERLFLLGKHERSRAVRRPRHRTDSRLCVPVNRSNAGHDVAERRG